MIVAGGIDTEPSAMLAPFSSRLARTWLARDATSRHMRIEGSLAFLDISGFTRMSERLGRDAKLGVESVTDVVSQMFEGLSRIVVDHGGDVLQFSGDAILALFTEDGHELRAAAAAFSIQRHLRHAGRVETEQGAVRLAMSAGIASGSVDCFMLGEDQRVALVAGPVGSRTCALEKQADTGQILIDAATAAAIAGSAVATRSASAFALQRVDITDVSPSPQPEPQCPDAGWLVPVPLRSLLGHRGVAAEHRPLAIGFLGCGGLDQQLDTDGAGAVVQRLQAVARALEAAQRDFGITWLGCDTLENGADFFCCAGAPIVHEDDEDRLLLALRRVIDECATHGVALRGGAHRGRAFTAVIGDGARRAFSLSGDSTNLAARIMAHAESGALLASATLLAHTRRAFSVAPTTTFSAKGKRKLVLAAPVIGLVAGDAATSAQGALLGRDRERGALLGALDAARTGRGATIDISGSPGTGKSRLIGVLRDSASDLTRFELEANPYRGTVAYSAWHRPLLELAGIEAGASPAIATRQFTAFVESNAPHLDVWLSLLALPAGLTIPPTPQVAALAPEFVGARLCTVVVDLLASVLPPPTLIVAEDIHWLDNASRELLTAIAGSARRCGWVLCATRRSETAPLGDAAIDDAVEIDLGPLDDQSVRDLVIAARGGRGITDAALALIVKRAVGNPLFALELARMPDGGEVPESAERLIGSRVDALEPASRTLLREAAVAGPAVDREMLADIVGDERVRHAAAWAGLEDFVDVVGVRDVRFRHDLIRLVAYEGLPFRRRRELHAGIAEWLQTGHHELSPDDLAPVLAFHYARSGLARPTWDWSRRAAQLARDRAAATDAVALYSTALDAARRDPTLDDVEIAVVAEAMGDTAERAGQVDAAHRAFRIARDRRHADVVATARLLRKHGYVAEKSGAYVASLRWYGRARSSLRGVPGPAAALESAHAALGYAGTRVHQGRTREARAAIEAVLTDAAVAGDSDVLAQAFLLLEIIAAEAGDPRRAEYEMQALKHTQRLRDQRRLGNLLLNCGLSAANESRWDDAARHYAQAEDCYRTVGHVVGRALVANNRAEVLTDQGHYEAAAELLHDARRAFRAVGYAVGIALTTSGLSRIEVRAGNFAEAHELLDDAEARFRAIGAQSYIGDTIVRQVECLVCERRAGEALALADQAAEYLRSLGDEGPPTVALARFRAFALSQCGRSEEALATITGALRSARGQGLSYEIAACLDAQLHGAADEAAMAERDEIIARLGIVRLPAIPTEGQS